MKYETKLMVPAEILHGLQVLAAKEAERRGLRNLSWNALMIEAAKEKLVRHGLMQQAEQQEQGA